MSNKENKKNTKENSNGKKVNKKVNRKALEPVVELPEDVPSLEVPQYPDSKIYLPDLSEDMQEERINTDHTVEKAYNAEPRFKYVGPKDLKTYNSVSVNDNVTTITLPETPSYSKVSLDPTRDIMLESPSSPKMEPMSVDPNVKSLYLDPGNVTKTKAKAAYHINRDGTGRVIESPQYKETPVFSTTQAGIQKMINGDSAVIKSNIEAPDVRMKRNSKEIEGTGVKLYSDILVHDEDDLSHYYERATENETQHTVKSSSELAEERKRETREKLKNLSEGDDVKKMKKTSVKKSKKEKKADSEKAKNLAKDLKS